MGPEARPMFDAMMAAAPAAEGVRFEPGEVGGGPGWWCRPANADPGRRLLYVHGGGYVLGSAAAFRNLASQIAARAKADAFLPDYRLAPEHPFPAAIEDVVATHRPPGPGWRKNRGGGGFGRWRPAGAAADPCI
jgi:acetyl esterase/lipase